MRSGFQGWHRRNHLFSEDNFFGEFTFSDLATYRAGKPLKYRITCCSPSFDFTQTQAAFFSQNDFKLTKTFTLMLGMRYSAQTNIRDRNVGMRFQF
jgi:outer membrane receptor protein involved in Fe transport